MRKFLPIVMLLMAAPAHADITHRLSSSVQLQVNSAATQATRLGNSYSVTGNNVNTTDGTTANTISTGSITSRGYILLVLFQQPKQLLEKHSLSLPRSHRLTPFLQVQRLLEKFRTSAS